VVRFAIEMHDLAGRMLDQLMNVKTLSFSDENIPNVHKMAVN
jgi:hypothetical protein